MSENSPNFFVNFVPDKLLESYGLRIFENRSRHTGREGGGLQPQHRPNRRIDSGSRPARRLRRGISGALHHRIHLRRPVRPAFPDRTSRTGSRTAARRHGLLPDGLYRRYAAGCRQPALQYGRRIRLRHHFRSRAEDLPAELRRILRSALVRLRRGFQYGTDGERRNPTAKRSNCADSKFRSRPTCFSKTGKSVSVSKSAKICGFRTRRPPASQWPGPPCWSICRQATKWSASTLISVR